MLVKEENTDITSDEEIGMWFEILDITPEEIQPTAPVKLGWSNYTHAIKRAKVEVKKPEPVPEPEPKNI